MNSSADDYVMLTILKLFCLEKTIFLRFVTGFCILLIVGCAASPAPNDGRSQVPRYDSSTPLEGNRTDLRLRAEVRKWQGTPHRLGGTTRQGIDCSGFVQRLYHDIFSHEIPRTTELQVQHGKRVRQSQLLPGDLVFFKISWKGRHVGIYLGDDDFAHASSSRGVSVSNLSDPYWQERYWTSRRYLNL